MIQTLALLLDAYRELNSKKLFWITLILSIVVVGAVACFGINEKGLTILWWEFDTDFINSKLIPPTKFYKFIFANIAIPYWLAWGATILALISTASIFPDFIASGSIELTLSRPISRLRLFFTKYVMGLLFVGLQVAVFCTAFFVVIGIRGKAWEPSLFLAVPIVLVFFSYLFSVCVLFGLLTRSTIASLLLTMLVWVGVWGVNTTEDIVTVQRVTSSVNAERAQKRVARQEENSRKQLEQIRSRAEQTPAEKGPLDPKFADELEAVNPFLKKARTEAKEADQSAASWQRYSRIATSVLTPLPKTAKTIELLDRWLLTAADKDLLNPGRDREEDIDRNARFGAPDSEVARRAEEAVRGRTLPWVLGTSLGFEAVILIIGAWIFCRRDF